MSIGFLLGYNWTTEECPVLGWTEHSYCITVLDELISWFICNNGLCLGFLGFERWIDVLFTQLGIVIHTIRSGKPDFQCSTFDQWNTSGNRCTLGIDAICYILTELLNFSLIMFLHS